MWWLFQGRRSGPQKVSTDYPAIYDAVVGGAKEPGLESGTIFNHASTQGLNGTVTRRLPKTGILATVGHHDTLDHGKVFRLMTARLDPNWRASSGGFAATARGALPAPDHSRSNHGGRLGVVLPGRGPGECETKVLAKCKAHSTSREVSPIAHEYARASTTESGVRAMVYGASRRASSTSAGAGNSVRRPLPHWTKPGRWVRWGRYARRTGSASAQHSCHGSRPGAGRY